MGTTGVYPFSLFLTIERPANVGGVYGFLS